MSPGPLFVSVFLATAVEAVEATTIVLAAGVARDWRSSLTGALVAVVGLAVAIGGLGPAVTRIPLSGLRLFVGTALLLFGVQWLRKAILRAGGYKELHDEAAIYERELAAARDLPTVRRWGVSDWAAFALSFKGVLLEGLEIVVIVLTFGANNHDTPLAGLAAAAAVVVVAGAGAAVRGPLTRVPENSLKFVVGVMLTAFGTFWAAEGAHASWPGDDAALLVLVPVIAGLSLAAVAILRWSRATATQALGATP